MTGKTHRPRPFTPRQQRQNAAFLAALRRTGNVRLACRELGVHRSTYTKRRGKCAAFATEWDMVLAAAHAAFRLAGGERLPEAGKATAKPVIARSGATKQTSLDRHDATASRDDEGLRTKGGEPTIVRLANGRLQLRLAPPGRMTDAAEQLYLAALSASANVRLAAAAAGFAHTSFYARRARHAGFAREERLALAVALDRMNWALMQRAHQCLSPAWRSEGPDWNPLPAMSVDHCLHLWTMHRNAAARGGAAAGAGATGAAEDSHYWASDRPAERARRYEATGSWRLPDEPPPPVLPDLRHVTGWSKAQNIKVTYHPDRALFGGWRLDNWEKRKKAGKG